MTERDGAYAMGRTGTERPRLSPGPARTDTLVTATGDEAAEQAGKTTLLRRLASPREIAEVVQVTASPSAGNDSPARRHGGIDRSGGVIRGGPAERAREISRPNSAPAYYQGRPACFWITATSPRRKRDQDRSVRGMEAGAVPARARA
jgi:hypothetical protein